MTKNTLTIALSVAGIGLGLYWARRTNASLAAIGSHFQSQMPDAGGFMGNGYGVLLTPPVGWGVLLGPESDNGAQRPTTITVADGVPDHPYDAGVGVPVLPSSTWGQWDPNVTTPGFLPGEYSPQHGNVYFEDGSVDVANGIPQPGISIAGLE